MVDPYECVRKRLEQGAQIDPSTPLRSAGSEVLHETVQRLKRDRTPTTVAREKPAPDDQPTEDEQ